MSVRFNFFFVRQWAVVPIHTTLCVCSFRHSQWMCFDIHSIPFHFIHSFAINACFSLIQVWKARTTQTLFNGILKCISWFIYCIHALARCKRSTHTNTSKSSFNKMNWNYIAICNAMHKYKLCHCTVCIAECAAAHTHTCHYEFLSKQIEMCQLQQRTACNAVWS